MLPEKIPLRNTMFSDGVNGYASQERRNDEYGVTVTATRQNRQSPFLNKWKIDTMPDHEFDTYRELRYAVNHGETPCLHPNMKTRHRLNADGDGIAFNWKHCDICGHAEFIDGRRSAFDAAMASEMLN